MPRTDVTNNHISFFERRYLRIVFFVLLLIMAGFAGEKFYSSYVERNWQTISPEEAEKLAKQLTIEFNSYQQETIEYLRELSERQPFQNVLHDNANTNSLARFEMLRNLQRPGYALELFDLNKRLVCWAGPQGTTTDTARLKSSAVSYVVQDPMYSYFIASIPVGSNRTAGGYIVAKRLFDVNYPISNRFINSRSFASTFLSRMNIAARFDFSSHASQDNNPDQFSVTLLGADSSAIGRAYVDRPTLESRFDEIHKDTRLFINFLLLVLTILFSYRAIIWSRRHTSGIINIIVVTVSLWLIRYVMVWTDLPMSLFQADVFDPSQFASPFGFGIARSVGDVVMSSAFLLVNVVWIAIEFLGPSNNRIGIDRTKSWMMKLVYIVIAPFLAVALPLLLRGFAATVRSAVFDSTLAYNDPMFIIPSMPLGAMLIGLYAISISLIIAGVVIVCGAWRIVCNLLDRSSNVVSWAIVALLFVLGSVAFGILHPNPLTNQIERIAVIGVILVLGWLASQDLKKAVRPLNARTVGIISLAAIVLLIPRLDREAHELDRSHLELLAAEIVRPADSWLTFVVNRALDEFSDPSVSEILAGDDSADVHKLAFTGWAKSILSKEGYNCSVLIVWPDGTPLSDFHLGTLHSSIEHTQDHLPAARTLTIDERLVEGTMVKFYNGYTPVYSDAVSLLAGVWIELSASKQVLLRGDAPQILRNYSKEDFATHHRTTVYSEYYQNRLVYSSGETFSLGRMLPSAVNQVGDESASLWIDESIDGKTYETFYIRQADSGSRDSWIAISLESLDVRWHLFSILRLASFFLLSIFLVAGVSQLIQRARGTHGRISFRTKLLAAFVIVSLIPIVILGYSNRQYALDRAEQSIIKRLDEETGIVVGVLQKQHGISAPVDLTQITHSLCDDIAGDLGIDFHVYSNEHLLASSKQELFTAELLDERLDADAVIDIELKRKGFYSEHESIGTFPYIVGYRAMVSEAGNVIGIISVPTLFRENEIDKELMERNSFLFGAYALALLLAVLGGILFSRAIASPVHRLQQATRRIAGGDLSVRLNSGRQDEFGELEQAFDTMTADLKASQDQMVRTQRELAWKEMAKQVAHEIKNPLTPMKLSLQHLRQAYNDGVQDFANILERVSTTILEQIEALNRIASEFSHFARMPDRRIEHCDVHLILQEARNLFQQHPNIEFDVRLNAHTFQVRADREELRRMFINVIRNAIQAMGEQGKITIATSSVGEILDVRISDTGPGIPDEIKPRLFEPNFSTKTDGMGLGLAIVKKSVDDLNGTINIESVVGKGTTVIIKLPMS